MADVMESKQSVRFYASPQAIHDFARALLRAHNVGEDHAEIVAQCLTKADLRGVDTHGVTRLPGYLDRLRRGLINAKPNIVIEHATPVAASVDGDNGFGFVVGTRAMQAAMDIAAAYGIGIAAARNSTHFGMAASYVLQAVDAGYVALVFSNASPAMPPWGGRQAILGTSPFAAGAPDENGEPFILDMSPAVAARGKIRRAQRRGEAIPPGYALDAEGRSTTDPAAALVGVVLPIGGAKGSGLAMLMDVFSGVMSGAACAGEVGDQYKQYDKPQNVGHFFFAMKPDLFVSRDDYHARMAKLIARVHECPPAAGFSEVLMPGEPETRHEALRRRQGIPYSEGEVADLKREAERAGVPAPVWWI